MKELQNYLTEVGLTAALRKEEDRAGLIRVLRAQGEAMTRGEGRNYYTYWWWIIENVELQLGAGAVPTDISC